jgi:putative MATE family efflux protein
MIARTTIRDPERATLAEPGARTADDAVFVTGSTMRHVVVMSTTGAAGLLAIFFVDFANLFYISLLGQQALAAAVGYASTLLFFTISFGIGLTIAATAITARAIGEGDLAAARKNATASLVYAVATTALIAAALYPFLGPILSVIGAEGATHAIALRFLRIALPSTPLLGAGMCLAGLLRARGDARRAMYVTLGAGIAAAAIDPLLIFGLGLGIDGAALAIVIVRAVFVLIGVHGVMIVHRMLERPDAAWLSRQARPFFAIAVPAVLTQIATPVGNAYVTGEVAKFGDDAVAGWAIIGRIMPLAFAALFALTSAIGPILSQNLGARRFDRVEATITDSLKFTAIYSLGVWAALAIAAQPIVALFRASGAAADLIGFFCLFVAGSFLFNGALFVANACFNNLGHAMLSTLFNWGRATLGIVPFVLIGRQWGAEGVIAGWGAGGIAFGIASVLASYAVVRRISARG